MILYRLNTAKFSIDLDTLQSQLNDFVFKPLQAEAISRLGFIPVIGDQLLYHKAGDSIVIDIHEQTKVLPNDEIQARVNTEIKKIEQKGDVATKREKRELKHAAIQEMLPNAFSRHKNYRLIIMPKIALVAVLVSSSTQAETLLALLRKALGSLPVVPLSVTEPVETTLARFCKGLVDVSPLYVGSDAVLKSICDDAITRYKDADLSNDDIQERLQSSTVSALSLITPSVAFTLTNNLLFKSIRWSEELTLQSEKQFNECEVDAKDHADYNLQQQAFETDADLHLLADEINKLVDHLFNDKCLGEIVTN